MQCAEVLARRSTPSRTCTFKCNQCNVISCEQLKQVIKLSLPGFSIAKTAINLEGTCKNCL